MKAFCILFGLFVLVGCLKAEDAAQYYVQANQFFAQRDYATALDLYRKSKALNPRSGYAIWGEANCLYMVGQKQASLDAYKEAAVLLPQITQVATRVSQVQAEIGSAPAPAKAPAAAPKAEASWFSPLWRSALLPGWGQAYNGQNTKAWLLGGATWGAFAGVLGTYMGGLGALDAYHSATDPATAVDKYNEAYGYYTANQTFYIIFGFAYVYNLLDAALNAGAPTQARWSPPGGVQLAMLPTGLTVSKEWTW